MSMRWIPIVALVAVFSVPNGAASPTVQEWTLEGHVDCVIRAGDAHPCPFLVVSSENDLDEVFVVQQGLGLIELRFGWMTGWQDLDPDRLFVQLQRETSMGWTTVSSAEVERGEWLRIDDSVIGTISGPTELRIVVLPGGESEPGAYVDLTYWADVFETYGV